MLLHDSLEMRKDSRKSVRPWRDTYLCQPVLPVAMKHHILTSLTNLKKHNGHNYFIETVMNDLDHWILIWRQHVCVNDKLAGSWMCTSISMFKYGSDDTMSFVTTKKMMNLF